MSKWESVVEKLIRESMERGEFDNLPGSGEPLDLSENPFEDPDLRTAHRLLRNAGFAPAWIEERKDIDVSFRLAKETLVRASRLYGTQGSPTANPRWHRAKNEFRQQVTELNQRIKMYNLKAPGVVFHRGVIDIDAVIAELQKADDRGTER